MILDDVYGTSNVQLNEAKTVGDITIDDGKITYQGKAVGEVMSDFKNGYHPAIRLTVNGKTTWFEQDTPNLIDTIFASIKKVVGAGELVEDDEEAPWDKIYSDNARGAIEFLTDGIQVDPNFVKNEFKFDPKTCQVQPDPQVEGVWMIKNPQTGYAVIIYMKGYKEPFGNVRENNDFETFYPDMDESVSEAYVGSKGYVPRTDNTSQADLTKIGSDRLKELVHTFSLYLDDPRVKASYERGVKELQSRGEYVPPAPTFDEPDERNLPRYDSNYTWPKKMGESYSDRNDVIDTVMARRKERAGKPVEKNPLSHDKDGNYIGDKNLNGQVMTKEETGNVYDKYDMSQSNWIKAVREIYPEAKFRRAPEEEGGVVDAWNGKEFVGDWDGSGYDLPGRIKRIVVDEGYGGWDEPEPRSMRDIEKDPDWGYDQRRQDALDAEIDKQPKKTTYQCSGRGPNNEPNYTFGPEFNTQEEAIAYRTKLMADPNTPNPRDIGIRTISRIVKTESINEDGWDAAEELKQEAHRAKEQGDIIGYASLMRDHFEALAAHHESKGSYKLADICQRYADEFDKQCGGKAVQTESNLSSGEARYNEGDRVLYYGSPATIFQADSGMNPGALVSRDGYYWVKQDEDGKTYYAPSRALKPLEQTDESIATIGGAVSPLAKHFAKQRAAQQDAKPSAEMDLTMDGMLKAVKDWLMCNDGREQVTEGDDTDHELIALVNDTVKFCLEEYFGGKAWFKGGSYAYLMDVTNPNVMIASDGSQVKISSWAHGIRDYADSYVADDFIEGSEKWSWDEETAKEFFRPYKTSNNPQADHEYKNMMGEGNKDKRALANNVIENYALSEDKMSALRDAYANIERIDPASPAYRQLIARLDAMDEKTLMMFADAKIKFISGLARNRLRNLSRTTTEGVKVDRMVGHIKKSEKAAGKSDKDAEKIAWATANKRGMLDNGNKE